MKIIVPLDHEGMRIDKFLAQIPEIATRSRAAYLIDHGHVLVNGKPTKASYLLRKNDVIEIQFPEPTRSSMEPQDISLDIVFEDDDLIVVNKPAGLVVHPGAGNPSGTLVNALLFHTKNLSMKFGEERPGIVHRIDKETSGLLVIAKNDFAHENLALQFKDRKTHRLYQAVCFGPLVNPKGNITSHLLRHPIDRKKYASTKDGSGKWASTNYQLISSSKGTCLIQLKLDTGRTHQIRVHLSEMGNPIVGDSLYGADRKNKNLNKDQQADIKNLDRFLLHAMELSFHHPKTNEWMEFKVDWPSVDSQLIETWGLK